MLNNKFSFLYFDRQQKKNSKQRATLEMPSNSGMVFIKNEQHKSLNKVFKSLRLMGFAKGPSLLVTGSLSRPQRTNERIFPESGHNTLTVEEIKVIE